MPVADYNKQLADALLELAKTQDELDQMTLQATRRATRILCCAVVCAASLACANLALGATPDDCHALRKHGHQAGSAEMLRVAQHRPRLRMFAPKVTGAWSQYEEANNQFPHRGGAVGLRMQCIASAGAA